MRKKHKRRWRTIESDKKLAYQARGAAFIVVLVLFIILVSITFSSYPIYPRISGQFTAQLSDPRFSLTYVKQDRLTFFQGGPVQKALIGVSQIYPSQPTGTFSLSITIYDASGNVVASGQWVGYQLGTYSFTVVLAAQLSAAITYRMSMVATFQDGINVSIDANVGPS